MILFIRTNVCYGKEQVVRNVNDLFILQPGRSYIIDTHINLNETSVQVPLGCNLIFKKNGCLTNGKLVSNKASLTAGKRLILKDVSLAGEWNNKEVYSEWVSFSNEKDYNRFFSSLMNLCNGEALTHFYLRKGEYKISSIPSSAPIIIPSNVYWHNNAVIRMMPSSLGKYNMVLILKSNNVTIDGGVFVGDVKEHLGLKGEWGHGIKCSGSTNVQLVNLTCREFWGDGIDIIEALDGNNEPTINCKNITIRNVKSFYNRRQGLSIEAGYNISIVDSEFAYTGHLKYTGPAAGIDIEPWNDNKDKVWNVSVINTYLHDNKGFDFKCEPNVGKGNNYKSLYNKITLSNCRMGSCRFFYTNGIDILKSRFYKSLEVTNSNDVIVRESTIKKYKRGRNVSKINFSNCTFSS